MTTRNSIYAHQAAIRDFLDVRPFKAGGKAIATEAISQAAQAMNNPADLINAAIEKLFFQRYELPEQNLIRYVIHNAKPPSTWLNS